MTNRTVRAGLRRAGPLAVATGALLVIVVSRYLEARTVAPLPAVALLLLLAATVSVWRGSTSDTPRRNAPK